MKNENKNVTIPINIGEYIEIDFGEFSNAVNNLLQNGINRYSPDRFHKYKIIKDMLSIKNEFLIFWTIFKILLEKNFNYNIEFDNFYKNNMDVLKLSEENLNFLKEATKKETIYEYYVLNQFDLLCNNIYNKIMNISLFEDLIDG